MAQINNELILSLNDKEVWIACQSLILHLEETYKEKNIKNFNINLPKLNDFISTNRDTNFNQFYDSLQSSNLSDKEKTDIARNLLILADLSNFTQEVRDACLSAKEHVRDFALISGPLILGGLAVILAWIPVKSEIKMKRIKRRLPDGTEEEIEIFEKKIERAGPSAIKNVANTTRILSDWWKKLLGK